MKYIAHKDREREQTIKEHLIGTAILAGQFAEKFGSKDWGYCGGMLHDIGKYSEEFQKKINEDTNNMVDHATAGAQLCKKINLPVLDYCIAGHHAGLPDYGNTAERSSLCGRYKKKIYNYEAYQEEIKIPEIYTEPFDINTLSNPDFSLSTFTRMIYSCLVDADFLDTEYFMKNGLVERQSGQSMNILLKKLENRISDWLKNNDIDTVNGRRTEILRNCIEEGKRDRGIFRLTVPTGGGKTIAALAFALNHAVKHHMDRIIYVVPYISVIEQNAEVFREILGNENVLENHSNVDYEDSEELRPMQLASENWDKPIVVTTNVQFFESLFSNKSSKCRKIHNIANSVIILDEAQMLPMDYLIPCTAMLQELVQNYKTSIVLCTATQPSLDNFFGQIEKFVELCPRMEEQFEFFRRVTYQNIGNISKENMAERLKKEQRALCIVNTRKRAQELYQLLKSEGVYHLSTTMYPKHRKKVLANVKERLDNKDRCILIATSLVEAGVDLDFLSVYRQIAGIDSLIQAAGRCNRNGNESTEESKVYIYDFEDSKVIPSQQKKIDVTKSVVQDYEDISDLECITDYFKRLYKFHGRNLDKKEIMKEFHDGKYNFAKVAKEFRLIEQETKTIFICKEPEAKEILDEIKTKGTSKERMRKAGQYCVQIYGDFFGKLNGAGMLQLVSEDIQDFYELVSMDQYSEDYGLDYAMDNGIAIFV